MSNLKMSQAKQHQVSALSKEKEKEVRTQAAQQTGGVDTGLFSSAFAHVTKFPEMCEGYKTLNARINSNRNPLSAEQHIEKETPTTLVFDLPSGGDQPILH